METLDQRIARDGPLEELDAVGWAIRIAKRLEGMHKRGTPHGGVSPASVAIASGSRTSAGVLYALPRAVSTPPFRSPERLGGRGPSVVDDTWALAATLYAMLTGAPPFPGRNELEVKQKQASGSLPLLASFDVGDDDLQKVLSDALTKDLGARTKNVAALRRALEAWHPDPAARNLPPIDDDTPEEDALGEERADATVVRTAPEDVVARARRAKDSVPPSAGSPRPTPVVPAGDGGASVRVPKSSGIARLHDEEDESPNDAPTVMAEVPASTRAALANGRARAPNQAPLADSLLSDPPPAAEPAREPRGDGGKEPKDRRPRGPAPGMRPAEAPLAGPSGSKGRAWALVLLVLLAAAAGVYFFVVAKAR